MNRLILLGNGFDLAHGLNTGYNDFLLWYLKDAFERARSNDFYEDAFLRIKRNWRNEFWQNFFAPNMAEFIEAFYEHGFADLIANTDLTWDGIPYQAPFTVEVKSVFLEHLLVICNSGKWVDVENEYYSYLKTILKKGEEKKELLDSLNESLKNIVILLAEYLETLPKVRELYKYTDVFEANILKEDIVTVELEKDISPAQTRVLNFNYTATIEHYFKRSDINYIHGQLKDTHNPLIFGFGDEQDEDYPTIENENIKEFLAYIKSFWYFKTSNYHDLIRFIEAEDFQIFIVGHSCGLSDRTMLKMIFEHENCKSIKIFYHENEAHYIALTQQISRHFTDKGVMRKKIVPFDKSSSMPQAL